MEFDKALKHLLKAEGGLVDHPNDPGGITKYGISLRAYPDLGADGIRKLTIQTVGPIYKTDYWDPCHIDELPEFMQYIVFDCAVNQGVSFACKTLQKAVGAVQDGSIGPNTLKAIQRASGRAMLHKYSKERAYRYMSNRNWITFGHGWMSRLVESIIITQEAL